MEMSSWGALEASPKYHNAPDVSQGKHDATDQAFRDCHQLLTGGSDSAAPESRAELLPLICIRVQGAYIIYSYLQKQCSWSACCTVMRQLSY